MATSLAGRPRLPPEEAARIAAELLGGAGTLHPLPSERDQNFRVDAAGGRYMLKISNAEDGAALLEMQDEILRRLATAPGRFRFPAPHGPSGGLAIESAGRAHRVRLLEWVEGVLLADARPRPAGLLREVGELLGTVASALEGFAHPEASRRDLQWDLGGCHGRIERGLRALAGTAERARVERAFERFTASIEPRLAPLRRSVIQNDGNDHNVICGPVTRTASGWRRAVVGLVDAGDALECWTVAELAVGIAYGMLGRDDPLGAAIPMVEGFHSVFPLRETELEVLFDLARMRLCLSVVNSAIQRPEDAANEYLSVSEADAWRALERLESVHPDLATYAFRHACGLEPCPSGERTRRWLQERAGTFARVVEPPLSGDAVHVFDLGVGSTEMGGGEPGAFDTAGMTARLFARMRQVGATVGVGRYDEARCWYGGDLFAAPGDDGRRRRTVHIGIDLFLPPGSPVVAPLEGRIATARWNRGRLDYGPTLLLEHEPEPGLRFWTLYGHLDPECLGRVKPGERIAAGQRLAAIGDFPDNGDWPPHLHLQVIGDLLGSEGDFPGVVDPARRAIYRSICPDPDLLLGIGPGRMHPDAPAVEALLGRRQRRLGPSLSVAYRRPLHIVRGAGPYLYDAEGQPYLDAVNNVPHVGHAHPAVVAAVRAQDAVLNTNTRYLHENLLRYAERLTATLPEPLSVCYLVCSGSEANELAVRMARAHTRRRDMVVLEGAYHGNTSTLIDLSPYKHDGPGGSGAPGWVHVAAMPDPYRGVHRAPLPDLGARYAAHVAEACAAAKAHGGVAGFLVEPLPGCGGQVVPPPGYLAAAFAHVRAAGGVCIADEVQVGLGRVGTAFWAFESQGAVPDIVTLGKPLGNGYPLAAVVTTPEIAAAFANGMEYFNTFGGNPVACAAGLAVLDVIEREGLQENARRVGARLLRGLRELGDRHPIVGEARGLGLYLGVELVRGRDTLEPADLEASYVINRMRERGILLSTDGPLHNVLKIKPPLCFAETDADRLVAALDEVLGEDLPSC